MEKRGAALGKIDVTKTEIRVRLISPDRCDPNLIRRKKLSKGVSLTVCCPTGKAKGGHCTTGMKAQAVIVPKKFGKAVATAIAKKFKR